MPFSVDEPTGEGPLRRFKGKLDKWEETVVEYDRRRTSRAQFEFIDVEVLEAVDVYPLPVATIRINYSNYR